MSVGTKRCSPIPGTIHGYGQPGTVPIFPGVMSPKEPDRTCPFGSEGAWHLYVRYLIVPYRPPHTNNILVASNTLSPVSGAKQNLLNLNFAVARVLLGILPVLLERSEAVINKAEIPLPEFQKQVKANMAISQYRQEFDDLLEDPLSFIVYPVFDSFQVDTRQLAGVLATNIHWILFFTNILHPSSIEVVCVLENSFNQTLAYRLNGPIVTYMGDVDSHDENLDDLEFFADVNQYIQDKAGPETRGHTSVPLSMQFGRYTLRVYPARDVVYFNLPWIYAVAFALAFIFTTLVYVVFAFIVERRQKIVMNTSIQNGQRVAATEREMNEFLAHEIRNRC